jgi:Fe-Mn family superoxide dismutase
MSLPSYSRRNFLHTSLKTGAAITATTLTGMSLLESCSVAKKVKGHALFNTPFNQQKLPYSYTALEPHIDAKTMEIHFTKHAASYASNLAEAAQAENVKTDLPVEELLGRISKYSPKMRNNAGGHFNHELFWKCMKANAAEKPTGSLLGAIEQHFKSFGDFKTQFSTAGASRFGSGWVWLYSDASKNLKIGSTPNQDNPLMDIAEIKGIPLLGLDVWEHAYYLAYQNKRADYIENWWKLINWEFVQSRFEQV